MEDISHEYVADDFVWPRKHWYSPVSLVMRQQVWSSLEAIRIVQGQPKKVHRGQDHSKALEVVRTPHTSRTVVLLVEVHTQMVQLLGHEETCRF